VAGTCTADGWCKKQELIPSQIMPQKSQEETKGYVETLCGEGKAVPLQAWSCPEGSRKLRFPDSMTTAQDGGKVVSLTRRPPLPPGNTPGTHFC